MEVQPAVILAARMFVFLLQRYRSSVKVDLGLFDGICGSANDISALEVGLPEEVDKDTCSYTLSPPYEAIYHSLGMSNEEKEHFTLECFQRLAAIAARNGFAIKTQSPFHTYYAALLRAAGGRGTSRHSELMKQVAVALGSKNGTLQRDMDRKVEELVCFFFGCLNCIAPNGIISLPKTDYLGVFHTIFLVRSSSGWSLFPNCPHQSLMRPMCRGS
jgi:hypothetical protein